MRYVTCQGNTPMQQASCWTYADLSIALCISYIVNLCRLQARERRHAVSMLNLAMCSMCLF